MTEGSTRDQGDSSPTRTAEGHAAGTATATTHGTGTDTAEPAPDATTVQGTPPIVTTSSADAGAADDKPATAKGGKRSLTRKSSGAAKDSDSKGRLAKGGEVVKKGSDLIRSRIASIVWLVAVLAAVVLAVGALLYALDANMQNGLVQAVLDLANKIDGPFWRIFEFYEDKKGPGNGPHDQVKEHLVNWGLAAVAYLIAGRVVDRIIRP